MRIFPNSGAKRRAIALLVTLLLCVLLGCGAVSERAQTPLDNIRIDTTGAALLSGTVESAAKEISPCVVGISVARNGQVAGIGSGVVVDTQGYVLTNYHVAQVGNDISLIFSDGTKAQAQLLWSDSALDLAILKTQTVSDAARLGSVASARVGESVIAVGTPLTLQFQHTVTHGIISALGRTLQVPSLTGADERSFMEGLIQTDASINPGNSGGPLVNLRGEVIGIISMKVDEAAGIGFAIPIDIAAPIVRHFIEDGSYVTPYLGLYAFDAEIARYFDPDLEFETGLYVIQLSPNSPVQQAGLQKGDVLLYADGRELGSMLDLRHALFSHKVGETMRLDVLREGRRVGVEVRLAALA